MGMHALSILVASAIAAYFFWYAIQAIYAGTIHVRFVYGCISFTLTRQEAPIRYWIMVNWYAAFGIAMVVFALYRLFWNAT